MIIKLITVFLIIATLHLPRTLGLKCLVCDYYAPVDSCPNAVSESSKPHPCRDALTNAHSEECKAGDNACTTRIVGFKGEDRLKFVKRYCGSHTFPTSEHIDGNGKTEYRPFTSDTEIHKEKAWKTFYCNNGKDNCNKDKDLTGLTNKADKPEIPLPPECPACPKSVYEKPQPLLVALLAIMSLTTVTILFWPILSRICCLL